MPSHKKNVKQPGMKVKYKITYPVFQKPKKKTFHLLFIKGEKK